MSPEHEDVLRLRRLVEALAPSRDRVPWGRGVEQGGWAGTWDHDPEEALLGRYRLEAQARTRRVVAGLALAACLLAGVGILLARGSRSAKPEPRVVRTLAEDLVAAVGALRRAEPERLGALVLHEPEAFDALGGTHRGGVTWREPRGLLLDAPSQARWRNTEGARGARLRVRGPGVDWDVRVEGETSDLPLLGPGRYVVTVWPEGGLARQPIRRAFEVASPGERASFQVAREAWQARTPVALHGLIEMHAALGRRMFAHALQVGAAVRAAGGDAAALAAPFVERLER